MEEYAEVIVDISSSEVDKIFDYLSMPGIVCGMRVLVPFGSREIEGFVIALKKTTAVPKEKLKSIIKPLDDIPVIPKELLELKSRLCKFYNLRACDVLRLFIPSKMRKGRIKPLMRQFVSIADEYKGADLAAIIKKSAIAQIEVYNFLLGNSGTLRSEIEEQFSASALKNLIMRGIVRVEQKEVMRMPYKWLQDADKKFEFTKEQFEAIEKIKSVENGSFLLHGVTGSGKTEVYFAIISEMLSKEKGAILLVPEISLTPQVFKSLKARFADKVAILHSGLSDGERFDEWRRLLLGEARVAVGARSAIFAPVQNLGLIVMDEEHDSSYQSESNPRYDTVRVAEFRKEITPLTIIFGSATPSVETYHKVKAGELNLLTMSNRVNFRPLPSVSIVNMCDEVSRGNNNFFSAALESKLKEVVAKGEQAMIFLNRRGYSSYIICRACGHVPKCTDCDISLVYHKNEAILKCHYCSLRFSHIDVCPVCKSESIRQGFVGTQRIVEYLEKMFPEKKILRMDNDATRTKDAHAKILDTFSSGRAQILVGTQMIAKGHDFPNVTLVGIVDADLSLYFTDYRSVERTFQLVTQVSGRAGRSDKAGEVILQTYNPRHYVYKFVVDGDYNSFFEKEYNLRRTCNYPPFARIYRILVSGENEDLTTTVLKGIFDEVAITYKEFAASIAYFARMRAPVKRIENKYRMQIILRVINSEIAIKERIFSILDRHRQQKVAVFFSENPTSLS